MVRIMRSSLRHPFPIRTWQPAVDLDGAMGPTPPHSPVQVHLKLTFLRYTLPLSDEPELTDVEHCSLDTRAFVGYYEAYSLLSDTLTRLTVPSDLHYRIIHHLCSFCSRAAAAPSNAGRACVPIASVIGVDIERGLDLNADQYWMLERALDEYCSLERALEESEAAEGDGMVPASAEAVKKMVKRVRVEDCDGGEDDQAAKKRPRSGRRSRRGKDDAVTMRCAVCLENIPVGSTAAKMPCSHVYHEKCIGRWLEESHYCPVCRFELPTTTTNTSTCS